MSMTKKLNAKAFNIYYNIAWNKRCFDIGYGTTSYLKYVIAFFGLASSNVKLTLWIAGIYAVFCYLLGVLLFKSGYIEAEAEVSNQYNLFQKEMREKFK